MACRFLLTDDDYGDLYALTREFFAEYERHNPAIFGVKELTDSGIKAYFQRFVDKPECLALIEEQAGRIVGYLTASITVKADVFKENRYGNISGMMVNRDYRRRGVATRLMSRAVQFFRQNGLKYYTLHTAVGNLGAIRFYESVGMSPLQTTMIGSTEASFMKGKYT